MKVEHLNRWLTLVANLGVLAGIAVLVSPEFRVASRSGDARWESAPAPAKRSAGG